MPTTLTAMGREVTGTVGELVADYSDASGRYVHYLINDDETDAPAYLLTSFGVDGCQVLEVMRVEALDGRATADDVRTPRLAISYDTRLAAPYGADGVTWIDGLAYVTRWADDVVVCGADLPEA